MINSAIEKEANNFRKNHGIGSSDSINLRSLLLKLNVSTLFKPLSDTFSGMAIKHENSKFILINTSQNLGRQNFTIGHELYHLFIQNDFTSETTYKVGTFNGSDKNELNADTFAAYFLMPKDGILDLIPEEEIRKKRINLSLDTVVKLEQYFQVSRSAMLYRLKNLGFIDNESFNIYSRNVIRSAIRRGFSDKLYTSTNQEQFISNYGDIANSLVESEKISEGDYYSLMMDIGVDVLSNNFD